MKNKQITCPNCAHEFDVETVMAKQFETQFKIEYERKLAEQNKQFADSQRQLDAERKALQQAQSEYDARIQAETDKAIKIAFVKAKEEVSKTMAEEYEAQLKALQTENQQRKAENKSLKEKEVALLAREQKLREEQEAMQLKIEKETLSRQQEIEEKARAKERESFALEKMQLLKQIEDNKRLAEEMKRKAEQGATQLQGEVQEIALENMLEMAYPFDAIEPVGKGIRGADCIQQVRNASRQICGSIVYESKRTKNFSNDWIEKLKNDQVGCKADIAVLVSQVLPDNIKHFGEHNGVWLCDFHSVKSLSFVLRDMLIRTHAIRQSHDNKGEKMDMLYHYLTSHEFAQHVQRIVENYDLMHKQINDERKAMERLWKKREKQIEVVQHNLAAMFGSIEGYTGNRLEDGGLLSLSEE